MRLPDTESNDTAVRAVFSPIVRGEVRAVDGAWWPRSRDLAVELPALVAVLARCDFRVARVAYHRDSWDCEIRKLDVAGRMVRLGWFRTIDPQLVSFTRLDRQDRQDLLVVPATSDRRLAARVFDWIRDGHHHDRGASTILTEAEASLQVAAPRSAPVTVRADLAAQSLWESEGGSSRQPVQSTGKPT